MANELGKFESVIMTPEQIKEIDELFENHADALEAFWLDGMGKGADAVEEGCRQRADRLQKIVDKNNKYWIIAGAVISIAGASYLLVKKIKQKKQIKQSEKEKESK